MPGLGNFTLVTMLVASFTYISVFNLHHMVQLIRAGYNSYKQSILESMKNDQDPKWKARAQNLDSFRPARSHNEPTAWLLPSYALHKILETICHRFFKPLESQMKDYADTELGSTAVHADTSTEAGGAI